jgi:hypothetical protein
MWSPSFGSTMELNCGQTLGLQAIGEDLMSKSHAVAQHVNASCRGRASAPRCAPQCRHGSAGPLERRRSFEDLALRRLAAATLRDRDRGDAAVHAHRHIALAEEAAIGAIKLRNAAEGTTVTPQRGCHMNFVRLPLSTSYWVIRPLALSARNTLWPHSKNGSYLRGLRIFRVFLGCSAVGHEQRIGANAPAAGRP